MPIFCSQAAANSLTVWAQTNSSLWTTVFSTAEAVDHCTHCLSVDHMSEECHKNSRSKKLFDEDAGPSMSRTQARHVIQQICKSWNYSHCVSVTYAYRHVCLECRENHCIVQCPTNRCFQPYPKAKEKKEREWPGGRPFVASGTSTPPGRTFLRCIINLSCVPKDLDHWVRLNAEFQLDVQWWHLFLEKWNGISCLHTCTHIPSKDVIVATDASGSWECGAVWCCVVRKLVSLSVK